MEVSNLKLKKLFILTIFIDSEQALEKMLEILIQIGQPLENTICQHTQQLVVKLDFRNVLSQSKLNK